MVVHNLEIRGQRINFHMLEKSSNESLQLITTQLPSSLFFLPPTVNQFSFLILQQLAYCLFFLPCKNNFFFHLTFSSLVLSLFFITLSFQYLTLSIFLTALFFLPLYLVIAFRTVSICLNSNIQLSNFFPSSSTCLPQTTT